MGTSTGVACLRKEQGTHRRALQSAAAAAATAAAAAAAALTCLLGRLQLRHLRQSVQRRLHHLPPGTQPQQRQRPQHVAELRAGVVSACVGTLGGACESQLAGAGMSGACKSCLTFWKASGRVHASAGVRSWTSSRRRRQGNSVRPQPSSGCGALSGTCPLSQTHALSKAEALTVTPHAQAVREGLWCP